MAFFLITATLYLTALALAHRITDSEYTDALLSSPPPTPMMYITIPTRL